MTQTTLRLLAALPLVLTGAATAKFARPTDVPVERLLRNTAAYIAEKPKDPAGYYLHARVNLLAYSLKQKALPIYEAGEGKLPTVPNMFLQPGDPKDAPTKEELTRHLRDGLQNFYRAIELAPDNGLYHLGLANLLEAGAGHPGASPPGVDPHEKFTPEGLVKVWKDKAAAEFLKAHKLAIANDLKITHQPIRGIESLVGYEAGESYLRLLKDRKPTAPEQAEAAKVEAALKTLREKPQGPITPIIFSLSAPDAALTDLLAAGKTVDFDLDGTGRPAKWPWVRADTCILVWDPAATGKITSGRQLFGSVTWWMFWNDGYHALDALDDDRDGELTGAELAGLAVWRDADGNGRSDPGEVVPVGGLGIVAVSARATHREGETPVNSLGLRLAGGRYVKTYDWVVSPLPAK